LPHFRPKWPSLFAYFLLSYLIWAALSKVAFCGWGRCQSFWQLSSILAARQQVLSKRGFWACLFHAAVTEHHRMGNLWRTEICFLQLWEVYGLHLVKAFLLWDTGRLEGERERELKRRDLQHWSLFIISISKFLRVEPSWPKHIPLGCTSQHCFIADQDSNTSLFNFYFISFFVGLNSGSHAC
jgi:hypothetical protein